MTDTSRIGLTGLAVMGANLARNIARHDIPIAVHNRTASKTETFIDEFGDEGPLTGTGSTEEFVAALERPRQIIVMVKAGAPVDGVIDELTPHLDDGDIVIDAGNSHFADTRRRTKACEERGLRFIGTGVSGGEEGALNGPSIMPGGDKAAYGELADTFEAIAANVDDTPCCTYVGADGAGHYVKMVHNGIEYADIQLIAEAYDLLRHGVGMEVAEISKTFEEWNSGDLDSFLIEITARVLGKTDDSTGEPLIDVILDQAEQKGTGRWTAQDALELGVPLTGITEAVFARSLSALGDERKHASGLLEGPRPGEGGREDRSLVDDVQTALYASKVVAYAQGFQQMAAASEKYEWDLDLGAMARIWRGGCIIRARFLDRITRPTRRTRRWRTCSWCRTSATRSPRARTPGGASSATRSTAASRSRRSRRRSPTTTATGASADRRRSSRGCATCSARTPTSGSTARAPSTRAGARTATRSAPTTDRTRARARTMAA